MRPLPSYSISRISGYASSPSSSSGSMEDLSWAEPASMSEEKDGQ
ncbi:hypothetical protein AB0I94_13970 [Streptomyces sp. NPDC050147]